MRTGKVTEQATHITRGDFDAVTVTGTMTGLVTSEHVSIKPLAVEPVIGERCRPHRP